MIPDEDFKERDLNFTWTITSYKDQEMKILLNFKNPDSVSVSANPDILTVNFVAASLLLRELDKMPIAENTELDIDLPLIINQEKLASFINYTDTVKTTSKMVTIILLVVNYLM